MILNVYKEETNKKFQNIIDDKLNSLELKKNKRTDRYWIIRIYIW